MSDRIEHEETVDDPFPALPDTVRAKFLDNLLTAEQRRSIRRVQSTQDQNLTRIPILDVASIAPVEHRPPPYRGFILNQSKVDEQLSSDGLNSGHMRIIEGMIMRSLRKAQEFERDFAIVKLRHEISNLKRDRSLVTQRRFTEAVVATLSGLQKAAGFAVLIADTFDVEELRHALLDSGFRPIDEGFRLITLVNTHSGRRGITLDVLLGYLRTQNAPWTRPWTQPDEADAPNQPTDLERFRFWCSSFGTYKLALPNRPRAASREHNGLNIGDDESAARHQETGGIGLTQAS